MMAVDLAELKPIEDPTRRDAVIKAVAELNASDDVMSAALSELGGLSSQTALEYVDANPDGVFSVGPDGDRFQVVANIYVMLNYGKSKASPSMSNSFPVSIKGHFDQETAVVDGVHVDTASFYS